MKQKTKQPGSTRRQSSWQQRFKELKAFNKEHGHCNVPAKYQPNPALGRWVVTLRYQKKHGTLTEDKVLILDALGFVWVRKVSWIQRINDLKAFKKEHGHCMVPNRYSLDSALGWWLADIRKRKELGKLDEKTIQFLDALGVCWKWQTTWKQRITDLKAFKKEHGHCNVPQKYQPNPVLGKWVANVGQRKRLGVLTEDKILCLDALGFSWARRPHAVMASWKQRINDLKAFKKEYGHCNVPSIYQPNLALGHWVAKMRHWKKRGKLAEDKILILDGLGFAWAIKPRGVQVSWKQRIHDLEAFKKKHCHCNVPKRYSLNPALGQWVAKMRHWKKRGKLAEDKILILDALGFCWDRLLDS